VVDSVTTNPSTMFKDGVHDAEAGARRFASLLGDRTFSIEVTTNDPAEMARQAQQSASWAGKTGLERNGKGGASQ